MRVAAWWQYMVNMGEETTCYKIKFQIGEQIRDNSSVNIQVHASLSGESKVKT
jgi:hypothetical protein